MSRIESIANYGPGAEIFARFLPARGLTILVRFVYGQDRRYERRFKARADVTGKPDFSRLDDLWSSWLFEARMYGAAVEMVRATQGEST